MLKKKKKREKRKQQQQKFHSTEVVLKAKWKGLRDNFRVEYKRIPRTESGQLMIEPATFDSKWIHYYALLFLIEHMRHRTPKNEKDQTYLLTQQSQDTVEKTIVEPDLTNGLISRLQDSDEEFDENDAEEYNIDVDNKHLNIMVNPNPNLNPNNETSKTSTLKTINAIENYPAPPAAHSQSQIHRSDHLFIKCEEVASAILKDVSFLGTPPQAHNASQQQKVSSSSSGSSSSIDNEIVAEDLSTTTTMEFLNRIAIKFRNQTPNENNHNHNHILENDITMSNNGEQEAFIKKGSSSTIYPPPPPPYNQQNVNACSSSGNIVFDTVNQQHMLDIWKPHHLKRSHMETTFNIPSVRTHVPQDDDYHYLLSLHPYMQQLKGAQKLRTRTKIQKLIFKELFFNDDSEDGSK